MKTDYTREELVAICERAMVPQDKWNDHGSCSAQIGVGAALVLLKAGCKFDVLTADNQKGERAPLITNEKTIWIRFWVHNFMWFEIGDEDDPDGFKHENMICLPTPEHLDEAQGNDWY